MSRPPTEATEIASICYETEVAGEQLVTHKPDTAPASPKAIDAIIKLSGVDDVEGEWIPRLVDYPKPPERMLDFAAKALPPAHEAIADLSARELSVLVSNVLVRYTQVTDNWSTYRSEAAARAYLGVEEFPHNSLGEIKATHGVFVGPALERIQGTLSEQSAAEAQELVQTAKKLARSKEDRFFSPPWIDTRNGYFWSLFGDRVPAQEPTLTTKSLSLARLALEVSPVGGRRNPAVADRATIHTSVSAILANHDTLAHDPANTSVIFGLIDPDKVLERVGTLTARTIWIWERAWARHNKQHGIKAKDHPSPFNELTAEQLDLSDFEHPVLRRVVEVAAAVMEILQLGYPAGNSGSRYNANLASFIAKHGPVYAAEWISGGIVRNKYSENERYAEEILALASRGFLASIAINQNRDPLGVLENIYRRYESDLNDTSLMALTGWDKRQVRKVFPPNIRFRIARHYANSDPRDVVMSVARAVTGKIDHLEPSELVEIIVSNRNPSAKIIQLAERLRRLDGLAEEASEMLGWSTREVRRLFTDAVLRNIARKPGEPLDEIRRIAENYDTYLSTPNLMKEFRLSEAQCRLSFPEYARRNLARRTNCRDKTKEMLRTAAELSSFGLPESLVINLAVQHSPDKAKNLARRISDELANRPHNTSKAAWAWVVNTLPNGSYEKRLRRLAAYHDVLRTVYSDDISLDATNSSGRSTYAYVNDVSALDPADILIAEESGSDAFTRLQKLAELADISPDQLQDLLDQFTSGNDGLEPLLEKLRAAGNQPS